MWVSTMSGPPPETTQCTHPIPGQKLKFLTSPGIEPRPPDWKAGTLPPRHGDGCSVFSKSRINRRPIKSIKF